MHILESTEIYRNINGVYNHTYTSNMVTLKQIIYVSIAPKLTGLSLEQLAMILKSLSTEPLKWLSV